MWQVVNQVEGGVCNWKVFCEPHTLQWQIMAITFVFGGYFVWNFVSFSLFWIVCYTVFCSLYCLFLLYLVHCLFYSVSSSFELSVVLYLVYCLFYCVLWTVFCTVYQGDRRGQPILHQSFQSLITLITSPPGLIFCIKTFSWILYRMNSNSNT